MDPDGRDPFSWLWGKISNWANSEFKDPTYPYLDFALHVPLYTSPDWMSGYTPGGYNPLTDPNIQVQQQYQQKQQTINKAASRFEDRLYKNKDCMDLFGGLFWAQAFSGMISRNEIRLDPHGDIPQMDKNGNFTAAGAYPVGNYIYINANGSFFNPVITYIQGGQGWHNFLADWQRQFGMPNMDVDMYQEIMVAHELGHLAGVLQPNDKGDSAAQDRNTRRVIDACFR